MKCIKYFFLLMIVFWGQLSELNATVNDSQLPKVNLIVKNNCLSCHSSPTNTKLNHVTTLEWFNSGLIMAGDPENSTLVKALTTNKPKQMNNLSLSENDLLSIKNWIKQVSVSCSPANAIINPAKIDGCHCKNDYEDIRNASGELIECRKQVEVTCNIQFSQINRAQSDGCGCVNGYDEKRNAEKNLISCSLPVLSFDSEVKRYHRCYSQFARSAVPLNDSRLASIKSKKMTGTQACMDLLSKGNLDSSTGRIKENSEGLFDLEGMQVLSTFQKFHMSWFSNHNWVDAAVNFSAFYKGTIDLFYSGEPALYVTNSLFNKDVPYSTIVTSQESYGAIRLNPSLNVFSRSVLKQYEYFGPAYKDNNNPDRQEWTPKERIEVGNIIGIKLLEADYIPYNYVEKVSNIEYKLPSGGGVVGSNTFFMLNQGRDVKTSTDGGAAMYRRWSKYIYKDVLCRDIPVIRSSDVLKLKEKLPDSNLPFRNGLSCLQCHFSIDGLSGVVRNKTVYSTGIDVQSTVKLAHSLYVYKHPPTQAAETNLEKSDSDPLFKKRPALGNFLFRTYDGAFKNEQYEGTEELGNSLSKLDDLYVCAASRYYRFLTGINVDIRDYEDPMSSFSDSEDEIKYRKTIIDLGKNLKKHQSLNKLIEEIIASPLYLTPGMVN